MPSHLSGRNLSLLATLVLLSAAMSLLSSRSEGWTAPLPAPLAATPRGTVPVLPGGPSGPGRPVNPTPAAPQGIAPHITPPTPIPATPTGDPQAMPLVTPVAETPAPAAPTPTPPSSNGGQSSPPPPAQPTPTVDVPAMAAAGFPDIIPSATATTVSQATGATLIAGDGEVLITVGPGSLPQGSRLHYRADAPAEEERQVAVDQGLLLSNIAFSLAVEPQPEALGTGAPLDIQVQYQQAQVSGIDPASLGLYQYNDSGTGWQALTPCGPSDERSGLVCRATRPGRFLLAGTRPALTGSSGQSASRPGGGGWVAAGVGLLALVGGAGWIGWRRYGVGAGRDAAP